MTKVLIISDLHYERMVFRGVDESKAFEWLLSIVATHKPKILLSTGDWGRALTPADMHVLNSMTKVLTIYGNHENMQALLATHVDSSLLKREYIVVDDGIVTVYRDGRVIDKFSL